MKKSILLLVILMAVISSVPAHAIYTELGVNYGLKTTTFDENNSAASESITGSISIYFLERVALELSYTDALSIRKEKASVNDPRRTTTQKTQVAGADLILTFAEKKALFQPYIKGGAAQISRRQEIKIEGQDTFTLSPETAVAPSYGAGLKIQLTETFGIKFSYDVWKTPIGGGQNTDDSSLRAGVTWIL